MELGPKRPSLLWFWDPNSIIGVFVDPLGFCSGDVRRACFLRLRVPFEGSWDLVSRVISGVITALLTPSITLLVP